MRARSCFVVASSSLLALVACQPGDFVDDDVARDDDALRSGVLADGSIAGTYVARMARKLDGSAALSHHLVIDGGELELTLPADLASARVPAFERNTTLRVWGDRRDRELHVDELTVLAPPPAPLIDPDPLDPRVIATILLFWDAPGLNNGNADQYMFSGAEATSVFYGEVSYGAERVIGEVFGPYEIPDPGGCDPYAIGVSARAAMIDKGHNPSDYPQLMYHFPSTGCDFGGLADVGSPQFPARDSWYHDSFGCTVRNQEIGHNYGMGHSHAYNCGTDENGVEVVFADNCSHVEYGDPFDPMGDGCGHINAVQKVYMGWLDGCNVVEATADGTFNLLPLETPCNGTQALRVPAFDGRSYWLEYRQPIGEFDVAGNLDGIVVHVADDPGEFGPSPYFLDIGETGLMKEGDTFTDPQGVVSFTLVEQHTTHAVVSVTFPDGGNGAPTCLGGGAPDEIAGAFGSLECALAPYPADDTAPIVAITYPADGEQFDPGADFVVTAEASDDRLLSDLELFLDGAPVVRLFDEPWAWDVTNIPAGEYEFGVVARDGRNVGLSQAVTIVVGGSEAADTSGGESSTGVVEDPDTGEGAEDSSSGGAPTLVETDKGCGCTQQRSATAALPWLVVALGRRRQRRSSSAIRAFK